MYDATGDSAVLVVDDDEAICRMIQACLRRGGIRCLMADDCEQAKGVLSSKSIPLMIVDVCLPNASGLDLLARARAEFPRCKVILISGSCDTEHLARALSLGAYDYIMKPLDMAQLTETVSTALSQAGPAELGELPHRAARALRQEAQLRQASLDSIQALVRAVEAKDPYTRLHSEQVSRYAVALVEYMGDPRLDVESVRVASLLHDIGKIGVPDRILTKPGSLTDEEFEHIRRHPVLSGEILGHIPLFATEARLVRHHHERWDGRGYPDGLSGEDIPLASRVIHIADSMDAMLMARTYKDAYSTERMLSELAAGAGSQFDPLLAAKAIEWCHCSQAELALTAPAA